MLSWHLYSGGSMFFFTLDYYKRDCHANSQGQIWDHAFGQLCKRQCIAKPQGLWVISNMVFSKKMKQCFELRISFHTCYSHHYWSQNRTWAYKTKESRDTCWSDRVRKQEGDDDKDYGISSKVRVRKRSAMWIDKKVLTANQVL